MNRSEFLYKTTIKKEFDCIYQNSNGNAFIVCNTLCSACEPTPPDTTSNIFRIILQHQHKNLCHSIGFLLQSKKNGYGPANICQLKKGESSSQFFKQHSQHSKYCTDIHIFVAHTVRYISLFSHKVVAHTNAHIFVTPRT